MILPLLLWVAAASDFAGAAACKACHPAEFAAQSQSAHARALTSAKAPQPGEWAFGAGDQAITFVKQVDADTYLELGRSWYAASSGYGLTPGHKTADGMRYRLYDPAAGILACFGCHSTGPLSVSGKGAISVHEQGIRCEGCHGPSANHVRDPKAVRPLNPGMLTAEAQNEFCGACHRMPSPAGVTPNLRDPWNARHQPLLLAESKCFQRSGGKLTCLTCHAPHEALVKTASSYDVVCSGCHGGVRHSEPIAGKACAACHMPAVQAQRNLVFTSHRITLP